MTDIGNPLKKEAKIIDKLILTINEKKHKLVTPQMCATWLNQGLTTNKQILNSIALAVGKHTVSKFYSSVFT